MHDSKRHLAMFIQPGLDKASKYYNRMDDTPAYILAMGKSLPWSYTSANLIGFAVLNPAVKLTWIRKYWDTAWVMCTEHIIITKVSISWCMQTFSSHHGWHQLTEYSELIKCNSLVEVSASPTLESWESLANAYEFDFDDGSAPQSLSAQSVEDEFHTYVQAQLSPKGTNLLKFWDTHSEL